MSKAAFDDRVAAYARSPIHQNGESLALVVKLARVQPGLAVLDVSTGTGFTAHALTELGARVVAADLAPKMLRHALDESAGDLRGVMSDTQQLGFSDDLFDVVTCRHAFHHYADGAAALAEMARVVRPGGRLVIADSVAPDDPWVAAEMHEIEIARDPSHVRNRTVAEFRQAMAQVGFAVDETADTWSDQAFEAWCERTRTDRHLRERLWWRFSRDRRLGTTFRVREEAGRRSFAWPVLVIAGRKP